MEWRMKVKWGGIRIARAASAGFALALLLSLFSLLSGGVGKGAEAFLAKLLSASIPEFSLFYPGLILGGISLLFIGAPAANLLRRWVAIPMLDLFSQGASTALGVFSGFLLIASIAGELPSNGVEVLKFCALLVVLCAELEFLGLFVRGRIYDLHADTRGNVLQWSLTGFAVAAVCSYLLIQSFVAHAAKS